MEPDSSDTHPDLERGVFATTHWSVVLAAGWADSSEAMQALEKLCRTYWYPLYAYLRRRGYREHDAQDLTQGFFAHLLQGQAFHTAAPGRGKFRSYLLASLNHFLADERDRQQAQKRGGGQQIVSFDTERAEERYRLETGTQVTPEELFERQWAITLTDQALGRLEQEFTGSGKGNLFEHLHPFLVEGACASTYAQVAAQLGMTEEAVKKAVQRLRIRYQQLIRLEIAHTVVQASEIEEELRDLRSALGG
jgi:RNA polymerase sigma factor (sigma-70 family)